MECVGDRNERVLGRGQHDAELVAAEAPHDRSVVADRSAQPLGQRGEDGVAGGVATSGTFENWKGVINNHFNDYTDELKSFGWNVKSKVAGWTLEGDLSHSENVRRLLRYETTLGLPGNAYNAADTISYTGFNGSNLADRLRVELTSFERRTATVAKN